MRAFLQRFAPRLNNDRALWLFVFGFCAVLYALTARWTDQANDAMAAAWPAWTLAHHATLHLETVRGVPDCIWFIHANGHLMSNRTIGVVLMGVPANLLLGWTGIPALAAGALTAVVVTAAAVATMAVVTRRVVPTPYALVATAVLAFGTATWTVASKELWTHGPDALWLSLSLLALSRRRYLLAGLAIAPGILVRPHLVVAAVAIGLALAALERRPQPLLVLPPAFAGVFVLAFLNHLIWGAWSLSGGYAAGGYSASGAAGVGGGAGQFLSSLNVLAHTVAGAFVSPWDGVLLYTPAVLVAIVSVPFGLRRAPRWAVAAAVGGVMYLLAQSRVDSGFSGGNFFFSNRLMVESLLLWLPLSAHGVTSMLRRWPRTLPVVAGSAALSISIHAAGAILAPWLIGIRNDPWTDWYLGIVVRAAGVDGVVVAAVGLLATVTAIVATSRVKTASSVADPGSSPHQGDWQAALAHSA